jgi:hypothetical protein
MAASKRSRRSGEAAWAAQGDEYLRRLLADDQLRSSLLGAYTAARSAYGRLSNGKPPAQAILHDDKLQRELRETVEALRDATSALRQPAPRTRRRRRRGRPLLALLLGAALALALSSELRTKVLDMLFGAEEEFDYSSTTTPASPAPAGVSGS